MKKSLVVFLIFTSALRLISQTLDDFEEDLILTEEEEEAREEERSSRELESAESEIEGEDESARIFIYALIGVFIGVYGGVVDALERPLGAPQVPFLEISGQYGITHPVLQNLSVKGETGWGPLAVRAEYRTLTEENLNDFLSMGSLAFALRMSWRYVTLDFVLGRGFFHGNSHYTGSVVGFPIDVHLSDQLTIFLDNMIWSMEGLEGFLEGALGVKYVNGIFGAFASIDLITAPQTPIVGFSLGTELRL